MNTEKKEQVTDALKQGMKDGYEASKGKALKWWERALWVLLAGVAAAASAYLTGCSVAMSRLPDGTVSFNGSVVAPVTVEEGK